MKNKLIKCRNNFYRSLLSSKILAIAIAICDGERNWRLYSLSARTEVQTEPKARKSRPTKQEVAFQQKIDRKCCTLNWSNRRLLHETSGTLFHSERTHRRTHHKQGTESETVHLQTNSFSFFSTASGIPVLFCALFPTTAKVKTIVLWRAHKEPLSMSIQIHSDQIFRAWIDFSKNL